MPSGARWERSAERHLAAAGLAPVARNYRCRFGEIDLIMRDGDILVFVEVRFRQRSAYGSGAETIGPAKIGRIARTARQFLGDHPQFADLPCRFDVVSVSGRWKPNHDWITNAFDAPA
ncbi:MAG: YraN family protein [Pseudomonadota bacterium]